MKNKEIIIAIKNFIDNINKKYDMQIWSFSLKQKIKEQFLSFIQGYSVNHEYIKKLAKEDFVCLDTESHSVGLKIDLDELLIFPNFDIEDEYPPAPWRF